MRTDELRDTLDGLAGDIPEVDAAYTRGVAARSPAAASGVHRDWSARCLHGGGGIVCGRRVSSGIRTGDGRQPCTRSRRRGRHDVDAGGRTADQRDPRRQRRRARVRSRFDGRRRLQSTRSVVRARRGLCIGDPQVGTRNVDQPSTTSSVREA